MKRELLRWVNVVLLSLLGCSAKEPTAVTTFSQANFTNGDFESGDLSGWTLNSHLNVGIATLPPLQLSDLSLQAGGANKTSAKAGGSPESVLAAGLASSDSLHYPRFGQYSTVINELGNNRNVNSLQQTLVTSAADIDPSDGKIHVRFCLAPVLQNPGHQANQQPYFYLQVVNVTQNKPLFSSFNFGGQSGVPWKNSANSGVQYTDWQLFDLAPDAASLQPGDTIQMDVVAAGCSQGGHWGHLYVDAFGTFIPGLTVAATAASSITPGSDLTYTFQVRNGGATDAAAVVVSDLLPTGTTFVSTTGSGCSTPAVGMHGTLVCSVGDVPAGTTSSFQLTVHIDANVTTAISNGSYTVSGNGISPLIGPLVTTQPLYPLTTSVLGGHGTLSCPSAIAAGQDAHCSITPDPGYALAALTVDGSDVLSAVTANGYTLVGVTAAHTLMASFSVARYPITVSVPGGNGSVTCPSPVYAGSSAACTLAPAPGYQLTALNVDGSSALAGVSGSLYLFPNVQASHTVQAAFTPAMYPISSAVPGGNGTLHCPGLVAHGTDATCTLTPANGYRIASLQVDGTDVTLDISNSSYTLTAVTAPHAVLATFGMALHTLQTSVPGGNGSLLCASPLVHGQTALCQINPAPGYWLDSLLLDGGSVIDQVSGSGLQIANVTASHALVGSFSPLSYSVTVSIPTGRGTLDCPGPTSRGGDVTCSMTVEPGFALRTLTLDGTDVLAQVQGSTLVVANIRASHLLQAGFYMTSHVVSVSIPSGHGRIDCANPVLYGQPSVCRIAPDDGYRLRDLTLDGGDVRTQVEGNALLVPSVLAARLLEAQFESIPEYSLTVMIVGGHGRVDCPSAVREGQSATCTVSPEAGFKLASLILDGADALILAQGQRIALYNLRGSHHLQATFLKSQATACSADVECSSGSCVDGNCCDRGCRGACEACNIAGHEGTCTPIDESTPRPGHATCGDYICSGGSCTAYCQTDHECIAGAVCIARHCVQGEHKFSGGGFTSCAVTVGGAHSGHNATATLFPLLGALALLWLKLGRRRQQRSLARA